MKLENIRLLLFFVFLISVFTTTSFAAPTEVVSQRDELKYFFDENDPYQEAENKITNKNSL